MSKTECQEIKGGEWEDMFTYEWGGLGEYCKIENRNEVMLTRGENATKNLIAKGNK